MKKRVDVIVLGAGSMGMAAGAFIAKQGASVLLLDAFDPPHHQGSHHGDTRMIRHAYGEGKKYVPLVLHAQKLWHQLEEETEERLFEKTGVLGLGKSDSPFLIEEIASSKEFSLPLEILEAAEVRKRWPGIRIEDDLIGAFEPNSGLLYSEVCISAYRRVAQQHGAELCMNTRANRITYHADGVTVHTEKGDFQADRLIVTAGAWTGSLLHDLDIPLQPFRKTAVWYEADEALYGLGSFPSYFMDLPGERFYGFPSIQGSGLKIGSHDAGRIVDPDEVNREFGSQPDDEGDLALMVERFFPGVSRQNKRGQVCLVTWTPDHDFIIDRHPEHKHVLLISACSAHGFKFASAIGEIAMQMSLKGKTEMDITPFSLRRFM
ncbi:N-methyl-L-tryptophan oxidase [Brevibacillus invocatus]|uniref:N-methyl-L-tryptophan oxidase n=1 Tax=Brevibacillus invocatus TaxID=173959 RepID=UPI00203A6ED7|nr:N-methyl-L-tryptophan oxidase [Brevibacillus invocatus]MCM3078616.1 N-methyl-L-tryptophan oxidase [Brevibacillus invocatus]MCM3429135.1 N-methyl-L-tryptophan oxidase [Brevibacillus invocatus]